MASGTMLVLMLSAILGARIWFTEVLLLWNSPLPTATGMGHASKMFLSLLLSGGLKATLLPFSLHLQR